MQNEQLLRQTISAKETMMGSTPNGADWCIKALHPSDPLTQVKGIPDMSAATSLCMNYQTTFTLSARPTAIGTWSFDATLLPHPIDLMAIQYTDSVGSDTANVFNSQITGATHADKVQWLVTNAQQWRLAYAGVTVTQDGPDLANQGTIVVAQAPVLPFNFRASAPIYGSTKLECTPVIETYTAEDMPSYNASQSSPNAYFDLSKKGAYVPLKLTKVCQQWRGQNDLVASGYPANMSAPPYYSYGLPGGITYAWPHWTLPCANWNMSNTPWGAGVAPATSPMLNDVMAHISAKNLAVTTSFSFFFRFGIEMRVQMASALSPQLELAPRYDARALETYYSISRELKDAYEARYNDLGKLWGVITNVAENVLPMIGRMGPGGQVAQQLGSGVIQAGNLIKKRRDRKRQPQKPKPKSTPSKALVVNTVRK